MAEKKKVTNSKKETEKKKTKKKVSTSKKNTSKKTAVSSKKDTAKVVSNKKAASNKKKTNAQKVQKKTKKDEALNALDKELLENEKHIEKTVTIKEEKEIPEEPKKEEKRSALDELIGIPENPEDEVEDKGLFSSKVIAYLVFLLLIVVIAFIYVNNEDTQLRNAKKSSNMQMSSTNNANNTIDVNANNLPGFTLSEGKATVQSFFEIKKSIDSDPTNMLYSAGLASKEEMAKYSKTKDQKYYVTDVLYDDLRRNFESILTRTCFDTVFVDSYKSNNNLTKSRIEVKPAISYEITDVVQLEAARPTLKVTYNVTPAGGTATAKTSTFEFQVVKGKWIIMNIK